MVLSRLLDAVIDVVYTTVVFSFAFVIVVGPFVWIPFALDREVREEQAARDALRWERE